MDFLAPLAWFYFGLLCDTGAQLQRNKAKTNHLLLSEQSMAVPQI
jgi:hypothetical protein